MILIATDEAGYGPKLGPLVVSATAWQMPISSITNESLDQAFAALKSPLKVDGQRIVVNDSKAVFKPKSVGRSARPPYHALELVTLAGCHWCMPQKQSLPLVKTLAAEDQAAITDTPWLKLFGDESVSTLPSHPLTQHWGAGNAVLQSIQTRVISARRFNAACAGGGNKSDLLSQTTLELVKSMIDGLDRSPNEPVCVFCDRHGGRRYYAGPLQSVFDGTLVQVQDETKTESRYAVPYDNGSFTIRFTVKGDSFTPVAFSSMVAKYLREKAMESLNRFFAERHENETPLSPTAGYPVDADRYLAEIAPIIRNENIDLRDLVRER